MDALSLQLLIGLATATPFLLAFWVAKFWRRRRDRAALRQPAPVDSGWRDRWIEAGWWAAGWPAGSLPTEWSLSDLAIEWVRVDPPVALAWRLSRAEAENLPPPEAIAALWQALPKADAARTTARLRRALRRTRHWWSRAAKGWTGRPLVVSKKLRPRKAAGLPLFAVDDLTGVPLEGPLLRSAAEAEGPELVLLWAAQRRARPRFHHPLVDEDDEAMSNMAASVSGRATRGLGRQVGARLGGALGPLGTLVGGYLGGVAGALGGERLLQAASPQMEERFEALTKALGRLGKLVSKPEFATAVEQPVERILRVGGRLEAVRAERARRLGERFWPSVGLSLLEECLRGQVADLQAYREAAAVFAGLARKAKPVTAGGLLLQNPWLCARLPRGRSRLLQAREAVDEAAGADGGEDSL